MADIKLSFDVVRKDADARRVYGWFSVASDKDGHPLVDHHGDVIAPEDLELAAATFLKEYRAGGEDHEGGAPNRCIASIVFTREIQKAMGIPEGTLPEGWFGGFEINEEAFAKLAEGKLLMFSIEGEAEIEEVDVPNGVKP